MAITSAIVLFAVTWFMVMFITLPIRLKTQGDVGEVVPGTHAGAPANFNLRKRALIVTAITIVVWGILCAIIISGVIDVRDNNWMDRLPPVGAEQ